MIFVEYACVKAGLMVDNLQGEMQAVIKPFGKLFSHVLSIGESWILGNGAEALILEVPSLIPQQVEQGGIKLRVQPGLG